MVTHWEQAVWPLSKQTCKNSHLFAGKLFNVSEIDLVVLEIWTPMNENVGSELEFQWLLIIRDSAKIMVMCSAGNILSLFYLNHPPPPRVQRKTNELLESKLHK